MIKGWQRHLGGQRLPEELKAQSSDGTSLFWEDYLICLLPTPYLKFLSIRSKLVDRPPPQNNLRFPPKLVLCGEVYSSSTPKHGIYLFPNPYTLPAIRFVFRISDLTWKFCFKLSRQHSKFEYHTALVSTTLALAHLEVQTKFINLVAYQKIWVLEISVALIKTLYPLWL